MGGALTKEAPAAVGCRGISGVVSTQRGVSEPGCGPGPGDQVKSKEGNLSPEEGWPRLPPLP